MGSTKVTDEKLERTLVRIPPCTLPVEAYGRQPLEWSASRPPVWAWISWPHKPAEKIAAFAHAWNDRVVIVHWDGPAGAVNTVVWRIAVTRRRT